MKPTDRMVQNQLNQILENPGLAGQDVLDPHAVDTCIEMRWVELLDQRYAPTRLGIWQGIRSKVAAFNETDRIHTLYEFYALLQKNVDELWRVIQEPGSPSGARRLLQILVITLVVYTRWERPATFPKQRIEDLEAQNLETHGLMEGPYEFYGRLAEHLDNFWDDFRHTRTQNTHHWLLEIAAVVWQYYTEVCSSA